MNKPKILVVEDDPNLGTILSEYLDAKGFENHLCRDGKDGFEQFRKEEYQFIILDVMMPGKDGFTLAKEIRAIDSTIPILFLTAKSMKEDRIEGFKIGGDDYMTKPFSMEELVLRIGAITRRVGQRVKEEKKEEYTIGNYVFNVRTQRLSINEKEQKLTSKECDLLEMLCANSNDITDRTIALKKIWGDDSYFNSRSMDVYITKLRKYLKEDDNIEILNVHGKGFKLLINPN